MEGEHNGLEANTCKYCMLSTAVKGIRLDEEGLCNLCRDHERHQKKYASFFKSEADLKNIIKNTVEVKTRAYDCLLLYSGGKDSTYVLIRLLEMGIRVLAMTFDNGYMSDRCRKNIKDVCNSYQVDNVIISLPQERMDRIFLTSLQTESSVCHGCWRVINARVIEMAFERDIPFIVTGLSRGQLYELWIHRLMEQEVEDVEEMEFLFSRWRTYAHYVDDEIARLIDDFEVKDSCVHTRVTFIDFYRHCSVTKKEIIGFLKARVPVWKNPEDVGRCSSNCLINDAGIVIHSRAKGYHYYAKSISYPGRSGLATSPGKKRWRN
ncbi:MAG: 7-cyano-7-deazaguanine synthase [Deltaproteobacteria bacterium]|nr:7-cyano-7-deazaguanine synthase [Deltaproteobacteria bacterium]